MTNEKQESMNIENLTPEQRRELLAKMMQKKAQQASQPKSLLKRFEKMAIDRGSEIAIVDKECSLTFSELWQRVRQAAHYLSDKVADNNITNATVMLLWDSSTDSLIALWALILNQTSVTIVNSGNGRLQVHSEINRVSPSHIITSRHISHLVENQDIELVWLDKFDYKGDAEQQIAIIENSSAVQFKVAEYGVTAVVDDKQLCLRADQFIKRYKVVPGFTFVPRKDAYEWQLAATAAGATLIFDSQLIQSQLIQSQLLDKQDSSKEIDLVHMTPDQLLDWSDSGFDKPKAKQVVCTGGQLSQSLVNTVKECWGGVLYSSYFSNIAGGEICQIECQKNDQSVKQVAPIGKPVQGTLLILDSQMRPALQGVEGEIYIGGDQIPQPDGEVGEILPLGFISNPFSEVAGNYLLRLGCMGIRDSLGVIARTKAAGDFEYHQGVMISVAAFESMITQIDGVEECLLVLREQENGVSTWVIYLVAENSVSDSQIQHAIENDWPQITIPEKVVRVSHLPINSQGEFDLKALSSIEVIDEQLLEEWHSLVNQLPDAKDSVVIQQPIAKPERLLHLSEVLDSWQGVGSQQTVDGSVMEDRDSDQKGDQRPDAYSSGGNLDIPDDSPKTLTDGLLRVAQECPERGVVFYKHGGEEELLGYGQLLEEAKCLLSGYQKKGLKPGDSVILQVGNLREYFPAFWGAVIGGIRPVTVAVAPTYQKGNNVVEKLQSIWQLLEKPHVIASDDLVEPLESLSKSYPMPDLIVDRLSELKGDPSQDLHDATPDDIIFYQLSSGSTGTSKCIQEKHGSIVQHIHSAQEYVGYSRENIDLNWLPMDHVVPLLTCHIKDTYLGCMQIQVPTDEILSNPLLWLDMLDKHKVTNTWSPNFAYKLVSEALGKSGSKDWDLSRVTQFLNGGEQVTLPVVEEFLRLTSEFGIVESDMQPAFGMAEVCTCMTFRKDFDCKTGATYFKKNSLKGMLEPTTMDDPEGVGFIDLGGPTPGIEIRITDGVNQVIKEGVIGRFQIRGGVVTPGYLKNPDANKEAFVGDDWFNTGDLGFIWKGHLYLTGREKEQIIVNGANFYCYEIEDVVNATAGVEATWSAACGVMDDRTGTEGLAVFYVPGSDRKDTSSGVNVDDEEIDIIRSIRRSVTTNLGVSPSYVVPVAKPEFPKTTSGKIQRTKLRNGLIDGDYASILKSVDLGLKNHNTLPDWFYRRSWVRKSLPKHVLPLSGTLLVLGEGELVEAMRQKYKIISVSSGDSFKCIGSDRYTINPAEQSDYENLLKYINNSEIDLSEITGIVDLRSFLIGGKNNASISTVADLENAQKNGVLSLLSLVKSIISNDIKQHLSVRVITSFGAGFDGDKECVFQHGTLTGFIKTLGQEHTQINSRIIDIEPDQSHRVLDWLDAELRDSVDEAEVAYRNGSRWVTRLEPIDYRELTSESVQIKGAGAYVISGGLGGIGIELVWFLRKEFKCKLLLLDRIPVEEMSVEKQEQWNALRRSGDIEFRPIDIVDLEKLKTTVSEFENSIGQKIDGVFHLAGAALEETISKITPDQYMEVLRPKVIGAWALSQLIKGQDDKLFVSFSSVNGHFGGMTTSAYSSANSFLDLFHYYLRQNGINAYTIDWSMWNSIGLSSDFADHVKSMSRSRGFYPIDPSAGLISLKVVLSNIYSHVMVGLDRTRLAVSRILQTNVEPQMQIRSFVETDIATYSLHQKVFDSFGTPSHCQLDLVNEFPRLHDGSTDIEALKNIRSKGVKVEKTEPRTELERELLAIWQGVLGISSIGMEDNFFELGGHSLMATQLVANIETVLKQKVSLHILIEKPTIEELALYIEGNKLEDQGNELLPQIEADLANIDQPFPMTDIQQAYWIGRSDIFEMGGISTHIYFEQELPEVDFEKFNLVWNKVVARHGMLRMVTTSDGQQKILPEVESYTVACNDFISMSEDERQTQLMAVRDEMSHQVFDTETWPLFDVRLSKLSESKARLHFSLDGIVADGMSFQIMALDFSMLYLEQGDLPELPISFRDYVIAEHSLRETNLYKNSKQYWVDRLDDLPMGPELPLAKSPTQVENPHFDRRQITLERSKWQPLKEFASRNGITPASLLLTAFGEVLSAWSRNHHFVTNLTLFNRLPMHAAVNDLIGDFTSSVLLEMDYREPATYLERATNIQTQLWKDLEYKYFSGVEVIRELSRNRKEIQGAVVPVVFTSVLGMGEQTQEGSSDHLTEDDRGESFSISQTSQVWLDCQASESGGDLNLAWDAVEELFPEKVLDQMFAAFTSIVFELADNVSNWQKRSWYLLPDSQQKVREQANATQADVSNEYMHTLFEKQSKQTPQAVAVITPDSQYCYEEIYRLAKHYAHQIRDKGVKPNELVAVAMHKGWEQVVAVLAIQMAGGAYLPISASQPKERVWQLLEQGEVSIVLTQAGLKTDVEWPEYIDVSEVDAAVLSEPEQSELTPIQQLDDLAYVIFTSGSTGMPKGVMIDHRGAVNTILDINERYQINENDKAFALSALNFDLSVYDVFGMLAAGGTIVYPSPEGAKDPSHWWSMYQQHHFTIWNTVPALKQMWVEYVESLPDASADDIRLVLMSGDWIPVSLPDRIRELSKGIEVISLGGATEASIWSIFYPIDDVDPNWRSIPYGKALKNQTMHVLNRDMLPCADWVPGEIYIGGIGLAQGYWRDKEKTDASFVTNPHTGEKMYRTGDMGLYHPDGNIEFLGRNDFQVKIQGHRIELGEIEAALLTHSSIAEAVVNAVGENASNKRLVGYVVLKDQEQADQIERTLQVYLAQKIPDYMVPPRILVIEQIPLSANGKVDRKALPVDAEELSVHEEYIEPEGEIECKVAAIWHEILEQPKVGANDNFFDLGGDSLKATRVVVRVREEFSFDLPIIHLFQSPTLRQIAEIIAVAVSSQISDEIADDEEEFTF